MKKLILLMRLAIMMLLGVYGIQYTVAAEGNTVLDISEIQEDITVNANMEMNDLILDLHIYQQLQEKIYIEKNSSILTNYNESICEKADERIELIKQYESSMGVEIFNADIKYTVEDIVSEYGIYTIKVYEYILFEYGYADIDTTDISGYGIMHTITVEHSEEDFFVIADEYIDDYMLEYAYISSDSYQTENYSISLLSVNYNYDYSPNAAVAYADAWVPHSINGGCNPSYYNPAYTYYNGNDCANYVSQCLYAGGMPQTSTWKPGVSTWTTVAGVRDYFNNYGTNVALTSSNIKDVVWKGCPLYIKNSSNSHVVICTGYASDGWPYLNGHTNDRYHQRVPTGYYTNTIQLTPYKDYEPTQYYSLQGNLEECIGGENSISVAGWAFDADDINSSLEIHIYIGGVAGDPNAEGHPIKADIYRKDVNDAWGIRGNHGFSSIIHTNKCGIQDVYIYALSIGGGDNLFLGVYTVEIINENEPPIISDIQITNIHNNGYTISCIVKDNYGIEKVMFPTWTTYNDQDDIIWYEGIIHGNKASIDINISSHNNEHGYYKTHIYAYDVNGNIYSKHTADIGMIYIPIEATQKIEILTPKKKYILFDNENNLTWSDAKIYCEQQGGYLATISSQNEQDAIKSLIDQGKRNAYFIGGTDFNSEGIWHWVNEEQWIFDNWREGEPNNSGNLGNLPENYLGVYNYKNNYEWNDFTNNPDELLGFICEIDLPYISTSVYDYDTYKLCKPELFNMSTSCSIIVSSYRNNILVSCESRSSSDNNPYVLLDNIDTVKIMVFDNLVSLTPICNAEVIPSSEFITE